MRRPQKYEKISLFLWHYLVDSEKLGDFFQINVAFSEYMNLTKVSLLGVVALCGNHTFIPADWGSL